VPETGRISLAVNEAATNISLAGAVASDAPSCAVLVLDAMGMVVAANETARELWGAPEKTLVSQSLTQLIFAGTASPDLETSTAWKTLKATIVDRGAPLLARRRDGSSFGVRVQLERSLGGAGTYIATIAAA
jgi:PAS domain-containing protein